jgi:hypothetical protein
MLYYGFFPLLNNEGIGANSSSSIYWNWVAREAYRASINDPT